jgi:hypothetical protein
MSAARVRLSLFVAFVLLFGAIPAEAQIIDRLRKKVDEAKSTIADAKDVRCEVQGVCGEIWQSDLFAPELYNSLAVTVFDASGRYRNQNLDGMLRGAFEGRLLEGGFLLAASADADAVRERIGRSSDAWTDDALGQLKDFVNGVDAVLVLQIDAVDVGRCELEGRQVTQATVHLSARFLNVDAGDIPWIGRHKASGCADGGAPALTAALEKAASQLAGALPEIG